MNQPLKLHKERAYFYSPLSFLHTRKDELAEHFTDTLYGDLQSGAVQWVGTNARLALRYLKWDSNYFEKPTYRIEFADWADTLSDPCGQLTQTLKVLKDELSVRHGSYHLFTEIPSEDLLVMQALGLARFRLIETRLLYFRDDMENFQYPQRFPVRAANADDIPNLRKVAMESRNNYDRVHADCMITESLADAYLGTFIENSVKGFADMVLVPNDNTDKDPDAFFTATKSSHLGIGMGCIVLVAVGKERRGWHLNLMAEMSHHFRECGLQVSYMTTQSTNRAVIRNCEKLGYRYGKSTHVFSSHA
jgi:dTDP-4-amino-4,6-dideoxy-D-galactose acyltransferase